MNLRSLSLQDLSRKLETTKLHAFTLDELTEFLADRLGRHEMPRAIEFREALPRSPVGKLLPKILIAELAAEAGRPPDAAESRDHRGTMGKTP